jgi:hypothetical protein
MDDHTSHHIAQAVDALTGPRPQPVHSLNADELIIALADLATLAGLLGELATHTRRQLAAWATVGAHLYQAEQHASELRRCLNHACAAFAFTTSPPTAA